MSDEVSFATDPATAAYYEQRAAEYDEWYLSQGLFASRDRPGWEREVETLVALVANLPPSRTLDIACGSGFLTRHLSGWVVAVDQSPSMVRLARRRLTSGAAVVADALALPFPTDSFDRVLTGHFYGHLPRRERHVFLDQVHRVARELVVVDSAPRPGVPQEQVQERVLNDGSRHRVFKRYLAAPDLAAELAGEVLFDGQWFAAVRSCTRDGTTAPPAPATTGPRQP